MPGGLQFYRQHNTKILTVTVKPLVPTRAQPIAHSAVLSSPMIGLLEDNRLAAGHDSNMILVSLYMGRQTRPTTASATGEKEKPQPQTSLRFRLLLFYSCGNVNCRTGLQYFRTPSALAVYGTACVVGMCAESHLSRARERPSPWRPGLQSAARRRGGHGLKKSSRLICSSGGPQNTVPMHSRQSGMSTALLHWQRNTPCPPSGHAWRMICAVNGSPAASPAHRDSSARQPDRPCGIACAPPHTHRPWRCWTLA